MPNPREIAESKNERSMFESATDETVTNPVPKEPDYAGNPAAAPPDEKKPFK